MLPLRSLELFYFYDSQSSALSLRLPFIIRAAVYTMNLLFALCLHCVMIEHLRECEYIVIVCLRHMTVIIYNVQQSNFYTKGIDLNIMLSSTLYN